MYWILKGKKVLECSMDEAYKTHEDINKRIVKRDTTKLKEGNETLSTVFLTFATSRKQVFETCIFFPDDSSEVLERYAEFDEAEKGHTKHLEKLKIKYQEKD